MGEPEDLKALAQKCRRLAVEVTDEPTRQALESLASQYEEQARAQGEDNVPPGPQIPQE
jgi:hypothetical protein